MKVVKLRKNQKLFKDGFTHAFRFDSITGVRRNPRDPNDDEYKLGRVLESLNKIYNGRRWHGRYYAWEREYGSWRKNPGNEWGWVRSHYVAVRSEAVVTQVMLIM